MKKVLLVTFTLIILILLLCSCNSSRAHINSISDLNGKNVTIENGSIQGDIISSEPSLNGVEVETSPTIQDAVAKLLLKKTDAVALDYQLALKIVEQYDGLKIIDDKLNDSEYGYAFKIGSPLVDKFNSVLSEMESSGKLEQIRQKWLNGDTSFDNTQDWDAPNGVLKCSVQSHFEPICYKSDDKIIGMDPEIVLNIAEKLGYKIEFVEDDFENLLASVVSGKTDMAASAITITEARRKYVDFTQGYFEESSVFIVIDYNADKISSGVGVKIKDAWNRSMIENNRWKDILKGLGVTLLMIFTSIPIGFVLIFLLFLLYYYANDKFRSIISGINKFFILMPLSTWLLICYYLIFPDRSVSSYFIGIFALSVQFLTGYFGTVTGAFEAINPEQFEAVITMGYSKTKALFKIFLPQMMPAIFAGMEINVIFQVRDTSIVGFIAIQDIQAVADGISSKVIDPFIPLLITAVSYISLAALTTFIVKLIGKAIAFHSKKSNSVIKEAE